MSLTKTITKSAVKHIPQKRTKVKDSRPWINTEIRKNLRKLQRLYKQKKKTGDQNTKEKYKQLKHHTQKITRQSYWKYIENIVTPKEEEPHSGMKTFWTYIKHKRKDNIGISPLMMNGKLFCDPASKSKILNRQFKSAFSANSKFTKKEIIKSKRMHPSIKHQTMKPFNITTNGIIKLLKNLNPYKAQGPDNISPRILKELADEISPLLQLIYTKSLDTGEVPADWRTANVSPVCKKD